MRNSVLLLALFLLSLSNLQAQLTQGDLAIVGLNDDPSPVQIAVVALIDIPTTETFYITDYPITSAGGSTFDSSNGTNGSVGITPTATITAGTIFTISIPEVSGTPTVSVAGASVNVTVTGYNSTSTTVVSGGGDAFHIFQGSNSTTPTTFIFGYSNARSHVAFWDPGSTQTSAESYLGNGLSNGVNAIDLGTTSNHQDCFYFTGSFASGDKADILSRIVTVGNHTGGNAAYDITIDGSSDFNTGSAGSNPVFTVTGATPVSASITTQTNLLCNGESTGSITVTASDGTTPYTYLWNAGGSTSATNSGLAAGVYTVTVTDASGNTATASTTITQPASALVASASVSATLDCFGDSDGAVTSAPAGGTAGYAYSWSNSQTTQIATGLAAGTYSVTITDANGCTDSASVTLSQPSQLVASTSVSATLDCFGDSDGAVTAAPAGGTAGYAYSWSNSQTTQIATGLAAGTYSVTITDANGCTDSASVTLSQPSQLVATASVSATLDCFGDSDGAVTAAPVGGTAGYAYSWSNSQTTQIATGLAAGTYSVTITDVNGCTDSSSIQLTQPVVLTASVTIDSVESCSGASDGGVSAGVSGGTASYTYLWSTIATSSTLTGLAGGTYSVTITDANGCTSVAQNTVNTGASPSVSISSTVDPTCNGDADGSLTALAASGTSPYAYSWSASAGSVITAIATGLSAGSHTVTVTDNNGCTVTTSGTVTDPAAIVLSTTASNVTCTGDGDGAVNLTATGGTGSLSYLWSPGGVSTEDIMSLSGGTYTVVVTDANGCTENTSDIVNESSTLLALTVSSIDATCNGNMDGTVDLAVSGGQAVFSYSWSDGSTTIASTEDLNAIDAGTYSVTVTDANGCIKNTSAVISEPAILDAGTVLTN